MTSRLKHKLERENVNLKSSYLNESFVLIGTPLPALGDHKKDKQEYVPVWEQEVRDEKGRRRFHGAFTGGFSAGYFNTVGSKEGWAPQQFKSSRTNRAQYNQRPEDFMDEEDIALMKEDRRLENTEDFSNAPFAGTRDPLAEKSLSSAVESLIVPSKSSIGHTLLQKLGWRPGQGVGPRVTLRKLKIQEGKLGRIRAGMEVEDDEAEASKHTYAPRDARLLVYDAKEGREGLGFEKGQGMGRLPSRRSMYGTEMDDDDDPYGAGPSIDKRHYAFDQDEEDDVIVMGGPAKSSTGQKTQSGGPDRWHDGKPVLVGFILDPKGVPEDKWFAFPDIPPDWQPRPARVWGTPKDTEEAENIRGAPGRPLTHEQRGAALGEETRVSTAKSVFEYMSQKDRERLEAFAAAAKAGARPPPPLSLVAEPELDPSRVDEIVIPPLSPRTASAALKGFMPYSDDLPKQERYRSYLSSQTYNTKHPNPQLLPSTDVHEVNKELNAFAESARIFRPMSYAMSSRFTSGSASLAASDMKQAKPGLHIFDPTKAPLQFAKAESTEIEVQKSLNPREQAAADGKHGTLTRMVKDFYPAKLVCKRFHVADPHPEGPPEGRSGTATPSGSGMEALPLPKNDASWESHFSHQEGTDRETAVPVTEGERAPRTLAEVGMADDVNQGRDTLTYTKPSIDIFKAIFANDDEDEDEDDEDEPPSALVVAESGPSVPKDPYPVDEKPVDYTTFKPVFRRAADANDGGGKAPENGTDGKNGEKDKAQKKKDKKKKRKGVLSFDVGDDEVEALGKPKKKAKKRDEGEWVEKKPVSVALPPATRAAASPPAPPSPSKDDSAATAPTRATRKGAADFW